MNQQNKMSLTPLMASHDIEAEDEFYTSESQSERSEDETQTMPQNILDMMSGMINDARRPGQK
jgi:hypothetical protein